MENQVLSIEQMQELKELGIDISNASMCWLGHSDCNSVYPYNSTFKDIFEKHKETIPAVLIPTFTLQDILEMLPKSILSSTKQVKTVEFKLSIRDNKIYYMQDSFNQQWLKCTYGNTTLQALFNMLKWCKQNKYI